MNHDFDNEPPGLLFGLPMPMATAFGLRAHGIGDDCANMRMPPDARYTNSRGDVHGGAIATLMDCTLAAAARAHDPSRFGVVTIDMSLHFLAPARGELLASARCERRGRSMSFVRGEARDAQGVLVAIATGCFKLVERSAG